MLSQSSQFANSSFNSVEDPAAEPEHDEHGTDQEQNFYIERKKRFCFQHESTNSIKSVGEWQHHRNGD